MKNDYTLRDCAWRVEGCNLILMQGKDDAFEVQLTPHQAIVMALDLHAAAMKRLKSAAND